MPLYIKDAEVARLAEDAVRVLHAPNKTEAVRQALKEVIASSKARLPLSERVKAAQSLADRLGPFDMAYDHKRDMDDLWGA
jgi:antitoxin VapB